jgi:hypothetical protein
MAYTDRNFKTKKDLKAAVAAGDVTVFAPGPFGGAVMDGLCYLEGPHFPKPHTWYAQVYVVDGRIKMGTRVK